MKITYTFPGDCKIAQLRGVTVYGGEFCNASGNWQGPIDAVKFETQVDGRNVKALIAGKLELEQALALHLAAIAAKDAILASLGWAQYQAAQKTAINARYAYDAASERGYPVKQAAAMHKANEALDAARAQYPLAAAYAKAESYSLASHDQKASAGCRAMAAIESGADPVATVAEMESNWMADAAHCVANN